MGKENPLVTKYIAGREPFARPILEHLRALVHSACPAVDESIKWGMPNFGYHGMLANMAAFKAHCTFGFWQGKLLLGDAANREAMGHFGRITTMADLPPKREIVALIKRAMQLNTDGVKPLRASRPKTPRQVEVPPALSAALTKKPKAHAAFAALSPSHQREYCEWITEAKRAETVATRIEKTVAKLLQGQSLSSPYARPKPAKPAKPASTKPAATTPAKKRTSGSKKP